MMIHVRLFAAAVIALMAMTGIASATTVTSPTGETPTIHATSEGHFTLHSVVDITCQHSTIENTVESHSASTTAAGRNKVLTFNVCENNHVTVKNAGSLEYHAVSPTGNATITLSGAEISVSVTKLGITCVFTANGTHFGTLTSKEHATIHVEAHIPRTGGSVFCGSTGDLTGFYTLTHPTFFAVH